MSDEKHRFHLRSSWTGDSDGEGRLDADGLRVGYGRPAQMGGAPGRTNPEDMLLGAVAACYSITLAVLAERRRLPVTGVEVDCEGEVVRQPGGTLKYVSIRLSPRVAVSGEIDEARRAAVMDIAHKAEQYCLISSALRGNVEITLTPEIVSG